MVQRVLPFLLISDINPLYFAAPAQPREGMNMDEVRVRYMVSDLDPAVRFYTTYLGFK